MFTHRTFRPVDPGVVERMTELLIHRGPDGDGHYVEGPIGLGHRRLSILDLTDRGRNPMFTPDGRFAIVYNGEVYNYLELRQELVSQGVTFRTDTDTEVVLALYARLGETCLQRLNGMFALAIWDRVERRLFLARDRAGIKPLYYVETPDGLVFASEAKALLVHPDVTPEVDTAGVDVFMRLGYLPGDHTMLRGVRKLPPGSAMSVDRRGIHRWQYWDLDFRPNAVRTAARTAVELKELLVDAVRMHMRSDVPVGVFLSGGLDSSATVALLAEAGFHGVKTFSVAYREGEGYDESPHARLVARRFGCEHHQLYVEPAQFGDFVPAYVWYMDEPVTEAAAISLYFVSKLLRGHVTVALSGEGADELFAGYDIYRYMSWLDRYRRLPQGIRSLCEPLALRLGSAKVKKYARLAAKPLAQRYSGVHLYEPVGDALYSREFAGVVAGSPPEPFLPALYAHVEGCDPLTQMLYVDFRTWLVDDLLIKADKMTMANSVELRVPFLDYRVVEYAATIPSAMKINGGRGKWILKQAVGDLLPREIVTRRKLGFPTPLREMFRAGLAGYVHDLLSSRRSVGRGYFDPSAVQALIDGHRNGRRNADSILWRLVVLEEWHRCFADPGSKSRASGSGFHRLSTVPGFAAAAPHMAHGGAGSR